MRIFKVSCKQDSYSKEHMTSTEMDENYKLVRAHVNQSLRHKIINHEYMDFMSLLLRGKSLYEEDKYQIVSQGGQAWWGPIVENSFAVSSYFNGNRN